MADETKTSKSDVKADKAEENKPAVAPEPAGDKTPDQKPVEAAPAANDAHNIAVIAAKVVAEMAASNNKPAARVAGSDQIVKGGKYTVDGVIVNAWGEPYVEGEDPTHRNHQ